MSKAANAGRIGSEAASYCKLHDSRYDGGTAPARQGDVPLLFASTSHNECEMVTVIRPTVPTSITAAVIMTHKATSLLVKSYAKIDNNTECEARSMAARYFILRCRSFE